MGTRAFWAVAKGDETRFVYNHWDGYPTGLGIAIAELVVDADDETLGKVLTLTTVDEAETPTPEQLLDLKKRGYWAQVSSGEDWYSALRNAQGQPLQYIEAGYLPAMSTDPRQEKESWLEWGYLINLDTRELEVYEFAWQQGCTKRGSVTFDALRTGNVADIMAAFENTEED